MRGGEREKVFYRGGCSFQTLVPPTRGRRGPPDYESPAAEPIERHRRCRHTEHQSSRVRGVIPRSGIMVDQLRVAPLDDAATAATADLPYRLPIELTVEDHDTIAELCQHAEGEERDRFALSALRIGVLALRQARGQVDGEQIRGQTD